MSGKQVIGNKQWPHPPEALLRGRLVYTVKFYGDQEVQQAKGTEPIKEAVRKMKFNKQLRKAEGYKVTPKVELCINVDGIALQDPKSKVQQFKFPLHHISYCADDKTEKKLFTFIAKEGSTGKHHCFVLGSERNAEEITLTIGQAFDLAYKKFLEKKETQQDHQKQFGLLQQQVDRLQLENASLKKRIAELEAERDYNSALNKSLTAQTQRTPIPAAQLSTQSNLPVQKTDTTFSSLDDFLQPSPVVNGKHSTAQSELNTRSTEQTSGLSSASVLLPPPPTSKHNPRASPHSDITSNLTNTSAVAGTSASNGPDSVDAFGMPTFIPNDMADMEYGFKGGKLAIEIAEFDLNSLDPLGTH